MKIIVRLHLTAIQRLRFQNFFNDLTYDWQCIYIYIYFNIIVELFLKYISLT